MAPRKYDPVCSFPKCDKPHLSRGYCNGHYSQAAKGQEVRPLRRRRTREEARQRDTQGRKECVQCEQWLDESQFWPSPSNADGLATACARCRSFGYRAKRYGISRERLEQMLADQMSRCVICERDISESFHVDHDHSCCPSEVSECCGLCVRALLCSNCNTLIGLAGESVDVLTRAIQHIQAGVPA